MTWAVLFLGAFLQSPDGETLYKLHCAGCHGARGEGARGVAINLIRLPRASNEEALHRIVRFGIPGTEMPGMNGLIAEDDIRKITAFVRTLQKAERPQSAGDVRRGELLYAKYECAKCHTIRGAGGALGPDLTEIGARRGPVHLREALLQPETYIPENFSQYRWFTDIPDNFLQVRAVTKSGKVIAGGRVNEDPFSIQIRDLSGRVHSFWKDELKELNKDWGKSPMPSYKDALSAAELQDLVAYLVSLRSVR